MRYAWVLLITICAGCSGTVLPVDWTPLVATEASVVTMAHREWPPADADIGQPVGGPLDSIRDAKDLIRKGSELADRGKAILDQAERDGKITVDIRLPDPGTKSELPQPDAACNGECTAPAPRTIRHTQRATRRPLLFWRWRR